MTPLPVDRAFIEQKMAEQRQKSWGFQTGKSLKALVNWGFTLHSSDFLCIIFTHWISGCTRFLSSHIRRNDLDAPTYSSCSALSFCGQPFSFRFSAISSRSSFPGCTWILLLIRPFTSRLLWPLLTSAYSAQPFGCGYPFPSVLCRPLRVPHVSFPPSTCRIYHHWFRVAMGLRPVVRPYPQR